MRPIDADALSEIVEDGLRNNPHKGGLERVCHRTEYTHFLDVICRMPTIAPPPNAPLTLEELREMGDEWVWIKFLVPVYGMESGYYIKQTQFSDKDNLYFGYSAPKLSVGYLVYAGYGDMWLAYRRKPEEGCHETNPIQDRNGPRHSGGPQDGDAAGGKAAARRYR